MNTKLFISTKPYEIRKSREQGEKELAELVESEKEGLWVYSADDGVWHNAARRHSKCGDSSIDDIGIFGERVSIYHTHLRGVEKVIYNILVSLAKVMHKLDKMSPEELEREKEYFCNVAAAKIFLPSDGDISSAVDVLKGSRDCRMDLRVVSPHGMLTCEFPKDGSDLRYVPTRYEDSYAMVAGQFMQEGMFRNKDCATSISDAIKEINRLMGDLLRLSMRYCY